MAELNFKANVRHPSSPLPSQATEVTPLSQFLFGPVSVDRQCGAERYLLKPLPPLTSLLALPLTCKWNGWGCNFLLIVVTEQRGPSVGNKYVDNISCVSPRIEYSSWGYFYTPLSAGCFLPFWSPSAKYGDEVTWCEREWLVRFQWLWIPLSALLL